jgi:hypothetical protein
LLWIEREFFFNSFCSAHFLRAALLREILKTRVSVKDAEDSLGPGLGGALAYLFWWITGAILLVVAKNDYIRFHAAQSVIVSPRITTTTSVFYSLR